MKPGTTNPVLPKHTYSYDARGNIKKVETAGRDAIEYTYDKQNQLVKEKEGTLENTYSYDTYGNIRSITTKQLGTGMQKSYAFTYNDSGAWKDQLTKVTYTGYNGTVKSGSITYDEIGNPITYQDLIGFNLYVYCSNNPVINGDDTGTSILSKLGNRIRVSVKCLLRSLLGGGKKKSYKRTSSLSVALQNSNRMISEAKKNVNKYIETGGRQTQYIDSVSLYDKANDYEIDLSYSVGKVDYTMNISQIHPIIDLTPYSKDYYLVEVTVSDTYDFDEYRSLEGMNDLANNAGYAMQNIGIVKPYKWDVSYNMIVEER